MSEIGITQESINNALNFLVLVSAVVATLGGIIIYLDTKTKKEMKKRRRKK